MDLNLGLVCAFVVAGCLANLSLSREFTTVLQDDNGGEIMICPKTQRNTTPSIEDSEFLLMLLCADAHSGS
jgi:hypothetical protein